MADKRIFLLIGPKGSGKSYLGSLFQEHFNIPFIRVEDWAMKVETKSSFLDKDYVKRVFQVIEDGIRDELKLLDQLVFESIGLTGHFDQMVESLGQDFQLITIKVEADPDQCLERIKTRDQSIHISIPLETITDMNKEVLARDHQTVFKIDNNNQDQQGLIDQISKIMKSNLL